MLHKKQEVLAEKMEIARKKTFSKKSKAREAENKLYRYNNIKKDKEHLEKMVSEKEETLAELEQERLILEQETRQIEEKIERMTFQSQPLKSEQELQKDIEEKEEKLNQAIRNKEILSDKLKHNLRSAQDLGTEGFDVHQLKAKQEEQTKLQQEILHINKVEKDLEETRNLILELATKINTKQIHLQNAQQLMEKISKLDNCPTCLQTVEYEHKRRITSTENKKTLEFKTELEQLSKIRAAKEELVQKQKSRHSQLLQKQTLAQKLDLEIQTLQQQQRRMVQERKRLLELKAEKETIEKQILAIGQLDTAHLQKTIHNYKKMLGLIQDNKMKAKEKQHLQHMIEEKTKLSRKIRQQKQNIKESIETKKKDIEEYSENLKELGSAEQEYKDIKEELDKAMEEQNGVQQENTRLSAVLENLTKQMTFLQKAIEEKEKTQKAIKKINQLKNWLENHFLSLMDVMEKQVMTNIYKQFNELFQQWFNQLMEDETIHARLDEQFTPIIEQNGYETSITSLSGGERTSIALAYRLGLNKVINDLVKHIQTKQLIMLDEPTDGFSTEQLDKVRDVLDQLDFKQTIIVSHEPKIESFVDSVVRVSKNEHTSQTT